MRKFFYPQVFSMELRKIFAYRMDFWIQFAGNVLVQFAVAWFLWKAVFSYTGETQIGGYSFESMMLYYLLVPLISRAIEGIEFGSLSEDIYEGTLTRYLVYPVSTFLYKFSANSAHSAVFLAQSIVVLGVTTFFFDVGKLIHVDVTNIAMVLAIVVLASLMHFTLNSIVELTAFWADNVWSLIAIMRFVTVLLGGGLLPLSLFPDWMQPVLHILPFAYFINVPIRMLTETVTMHEWLISLGIISLWTVFFLVLFRVVWNRGKYRYTGVGI